MIARPGGSFIGVMVQEIDSERAQSLKLPGEYGVEITRIDPDSPAEKAGLKVGDVVRQYNGQRVEGMEEFKRLVSETPAGRDAKLEIVRGGAQQTVSIKVSARRPFALAMNTFPALMQDDNVSHNLERQLQEADRQLQAATRELQGHQQLGVNQEDLQKQLQAAQKEIEAAAKQLQGKQQNIQRTLKDVQVRMNMIRPDIPRAFMVWRSSSLGIEAESLEPQLAQFFGVKEGVLVRSVTSGSAAEKAGIKAGDVITKIDDAKVTAPGDLSSHVRSLRGKQVPVTITRDHKEITLSVKVDDDDRSEWWQQDFGPFTIAPATKWIE
jgi:C-terminal processing protease CtpA/Prc